MSNQTDRGDYDIQKYLDDYIRDYPDKEVRIINAAINTFSEKGFTGTKTREIAQRAGIAEGTIFRYFPSKDAILERMVPLLIQIVRPKFEEPIRNILQTTQGQPLEIILTTILLDRLKLLHENQHFLKSVLPELIHRPVLLSKMKDGLFPVIRMYIVQVIQAAKERKEIREDVDVDIVMYQLMGFIFSYGLLGEHDNPEKMKSDIQTFVKYILGGWR